MKNKSLRLLIAIAILVLLNPCTEAQATTESASNFFTGVEEAFTNVEDVFTEDNSPFQALEASISDLFGGSRDHNSRENWDAYANDTVMDSVGWDVYLFLRNSIAVPILIISVAGNGFVILGAAFTGGGASATSAVTKRLSTAILAFIILMILPSVFTLATDLLMKGAWDPLSVG